MRSGPIFGFDVGLWRGDRQRAARRDYLLVGAAFGVGWGSKYLRGESWWDLVRAIDNPRETDFVDISHGDKLYLPRVQFEIGAVDGYIAIAGSFHVTPHSRRFLSAGYMSCHWGLGIAWFGRAVPSQDSKLVESLGSSGLESVGVWGDGRVRLGAMTDLMLGAEFSFAMMALTVGVAAKL